MEELAIMMILEQKRRQERAKQGKKTDIKPLVSPAVQKAFNDL